MHPQVTTFGEVSGEKMKWFGGVRGPSGEIFCIPFSASSVLAIDPVSRTTSTFGYLPGEEKWAGGVLARNGLKR